jgi:Lon protease-like protein
MQTPDDKLISALSMICPFEPREKQALLEAETCRARGELLKTMMELVLHGNNYEKTIT